MSREYYVYIYKNPLKNNQPFYIGKGKKSRYLQHCNQTKDNCTNFHKFNTIKQIQEKTGKNPPIEFYAEHLTHEEACFLETELIAFYGRSDINKGILTNLTDGGEGSFGRHDIHTPEHIEKRASKLRGKPQSIELIAKRSASLKGRKFSQSHIENLSKSRQGKTMVIDSTGKAFKILITDPRYINGEVIPISKGRKWYYNPVTLEQKCINFKPEGWIEGRSRF